jgi:hypothetical protein
MSLQHGVIRRSLPAPDTAEREISRNPDRPDSGGERQGKQKGRQESFPCRSKNTGLTNVGVVVAARTTFAFPEPGDQSFWCGFVGAAVHTSHGDPFAQLR